MPFTFSFEKVCKWKFAPTLLISAEASKLVFDRGYLKKSSHAFWSLHPKPGLQEHCISDGQNKTFQGLFWGIVRLCRSNTFGDALKNMKKQNSQKTRFCNFFQKKMWNEHGCCFNSYIANNWLKIKWQFNFESSYSLDKVTLNFYVKNLSEISNPLWVGIARKIYEGE